MCLKELFAYPLSINSTPSASIEINGLPVGSTPYNSSAFPFGEYNIRLSAPNFESINRSVNITEPLQKVEINEKSPKWAPGESRGTPVRIKLYIPLIFKLS
ncbi:MAG: PEGA domain-containing protein [Rikenellaceae bacterium]